MLLYVVIILTSPTIKYVFVNQPLHVQSPRWLKELFLSFNPLETLPESMSALEALEDDDSFKKQLLLCVWAIWEWLLDMVIGNLNASSFGLLNFCA